jgi:hypothetical protein
MSEKLKIELIEIWKILLKEKDILQKHLLGD